MAVSSVFTLFSQFYSFHSVLLIHTVYYNFSNQNVFYLANTKMIAERKFLMLLRSLSCRKFSEIKIRSLILQIKAFHEMMDCSPKNENSEIHLYTLITFQNCMIFLIQSSTIGDVKYVILLFQCK